jgi:hypothetical protein
MIKIQNTGSSYITIEKHQHFVFVYFQKIQNIPNKNLKLNEMSLSEICRCCLEIKSDKEETFQLTSDWEDGTIIDLIQSLTKTLVIFLYFRGFLVS